MNSRELIAFRTMVGLSQPDMADVLGYKKRAYQMMESGASVITARTAMACMAYSLGITEFHGPTALKNWKKGNK